MSGLLATLDGRSVCLQMAVSGSMEQGSEDGWLRGMSSLSVESQRSLHMYPGQS